MTDSVTQVKGFLPLRPPVSHRMSLPKFPECTQRHHNAGLVALRLRLRLFAAEQPDKPARHRRQQRLHTIKHFGSQRITALLRTAKTVNRPFLCNIEDFHKTSLRLSRAKVNEELQQLRQRSG